MCVCVCVRVNILSIGLHLNLIKNPVLAEELQASRWCGEEPCLINSSCLATQTREREREGKKQKQPTFHNQVVCIKMQSKQSGCTRRTAHIRRANSSSSWWIADLLRWAPDEQTTAQSAKRRGSKVHTANSFTSFKRRWLSTLKGVVIVTRQTRR